ncbi:MAG: HD domain-containing protein [Melioribacteraceae bacterium]|nr:HD domain-containing protein [Melioribacteraceae bacterium]
MQDNEEIKKQFATAKERLLSDTDLIRDAFKLSIQYSLLVEEYIHRALAGIRKNFVIASTGSFSRRELSPFSDIDVMFIFEKVEGHEDIIKESVTTLWNSGIEVSHTVREFSDIRRFLTEDLHSYTQFFETRFILGDEKVYMTWNEKVFSSLNEENKRKLIYEFFEDNSQRLQKYGKSPKVLEPNVKFSAGGLRDLHGVEWMYSLKNNILLTDQREITQTESFLRRLRKEGVLNAVASARLLQSYKFILNVRNMLHILNNRKVDRFEFSDQEKLAIRLLGREDALIDYMKLYFDATNIIHRFFTTMTKLFDEEISNPISEFLNIELDEVFIQKGNVISASSERELSLADILRAFYYRAKSDARFDQQLRAQITDSVFDFEEEEFYETSSSVFFRELLKLPKNVGKTLSVMNELGVLGAYLPEFKDMVGFFQPGVYHCYTADEHTLIAIQNVEELENDESQMGQIFRSIPDKDILYLALLFHDIAKPISVSGHEIIGGEIASTVMDRLGYTEHEIELVKFLVHHHLTMEQVAFRRNINDPSTLNNFSSIFHSIEALDLLYLVTYADLSAVSPVIWTNWKSDLLYQLYFKTKSMLEDKVSGEELLYSDVMKAINGDAFPKNSAVKSHVESISDLSYLHHFSHEEISEHVKEIESDASVSVFFKEEMGFTNISIITKDSPSLLSRLCGALSINDLNIHDAKIFTRKDGIVIDSFNVTDYRTHETIDEERYQKIETDLILAAENQLAIGREFKRVQSKWRRLENKIFKRKEKLKIEFEDHDKYTIIDVYSPDRVGLLYQITKKMYELGLSIFFAKIATKSDDVVDAFYVLDRKGKKISENEFALVSHELTQTIEEML